MLICRCISKFRDNSGRIIGYRLQDFQGNSRDVVPEQLKQAILSNKVLVTNLTLTKNNKLVDKRDETIENIDTFTNTPVGIVKAEPIDNLHKESNKFTQVYEFAEAVKNKVIKLANELGATFYVREYNVKNTEELNIKIDMIYVKLTPRLLELSKQSPYDREFEVIFNLTAKNENNTVTFDSSAMSIVTYNSLGAQKYKCAYMVTKPVQSNSNMNTLCNMIEEFNAWLNTTNN